MKTLLIFILFIIQLNALAHASTREVEIKKQYVKGLMAFKKGDYPKALLLFNKISPEKLDLPNEFSWYFGKTLTEIGFFTKGQSLLKNYMTLEGEEGKYYQASLKQYNLSQELKKEPFQTKIQFVDGSLYQGLIVDGKLTGKGTMTWPNGDSYEGNWKEGKRSGNGTYFWSTGEVYEGTFQDNAMTGNGTIYWALPGAQTAASYKGEFLNNTITGHGTYTNLIGDEYYTGQWKNGQRSGEGGQTSVTSKKTWSGTWQNDVLVNLKEFSKHVTESYNDGSHYEGYLVNNLRHGEGTYTLASGIKIYSTWNKGLAEGRCVVSTQDSRFVYNGQCAEGQISGAGIWINQNKKIKITGSFYKTDFINLQNLPSSILGEATQEGSGYHYKGLFQNGTIKHGTLKFKTGEEYTGDFNTEGKFHGKGRFKYNKGTFEGSFQFGDMVEGILWEIDGDKYTGSFKNGAFNGKGKIEFKSGALYIGDFVDGSFHGKGENRFSNGDFYQGEWRNHVMHGYGWYYFANGTVWKGQFVDNKMSKECKFRCKKPL